MFGKIWQGIKRGAQVVCKKVEAVAVALVGGVAATMGTASDALAVLAQPDLSTVTTYIETGFTTVGVLAAAALSLVVGLKLWKIARRAI